MTWDFDTGEAPQRRRHRSFDDVDDGYGWLYERDLVLACEEQAARERAYAARMDVFGNPHPHPVIRPPAGFDPDLTGVSGEERRAGEIGV